MNKKSKTNETLINIRIIISWLVVGLYGMVGYGFPNIKQMQALEIIILTISIFTIAVIIGILLKALINKTNESEDLQDGHK